MDNMIISILLLIVGLIFGIIIMFIYNNIKQKSSDTKASKIIDKAKLEAERLKKETISEAKEEAKQYRNDIEMN